MHVGASLNLPVTINNDVRCQYVARRCSSEVLRIRAQCLFSVALSDAQTPLKKSAIVVFGLDGSLILRCKPNRPWWLSTVYSGRLTIRLVKE